MKRLGMALVILVFGATAAFAAPVKGKVASIDGKTVQITLEGEKADWVKKNAAVKIRGGNGKIVDVTGTTTITVTITSPKAAELKVGDEVSFDKGRVMSGC
jgi:hypothetical protein